MRPLAARTWWWLLTSVALGIMVWLDDGDSGWGYAWRAGLLAVGIIAAIVAVRAHSSALLAVALGLAVLRIGFVQRDVPPLPSPADAATWAHAITDLVIGGMLIAVVLLGLTFRRGAWGARELLDATTVGAGAGLTAWITLANPAIDAPAHWSVTEVNCTFNSGQITSSRYSVESGDSNVPRASRVSALAIASGLAPSGGLAR